MQRQLAMAFAAILVTAMLLPGRPARAELAPATCRAPAVTAAVERLRADLILLGSADSELGDPYMYGLTRAEVAVFLVRILGREPESRQRTAEAPFPDMAGHWAAGAVAVLAEEGVVAGYPDGTFQPNRKVSRAEVELMMARVLRLGAGLTLDAADAALRRAGIDTDLPPCGTESLPRSQFYLLLDRFRRAEAWSVR